LIRGSKEEVKEAIEELRNAGVDPTKINELLALAKSNATSK
jgi:predicted transcriptional regulator